MLASESNNSPLFLSIPLGFASALLVPIFQVVVVCVAVTIAVIWRISGTAGLLTLLGG